MKKTGFTLIELLIVVAIIGILAAIAVPNFLEAQARAKVARAKSDIRNLDTGLNAYYVDNNAFPRGNEYQMATRLTASGADIGLKLLSTPVSYLSDGLLEDPFKGSFRDGAMTVPNPVVDSNPERHWYKYSAFSRSNLVVGTGGFPDHAANDRYDNDETCWYVLQSCGPDLTRSTLGSGTINDRATQNFISSIYDPTNGTTSRGCVYRVNGSRLEKSKYVFDAIHDSMN